MPKSNNDQFKMARIPLIPLAYDNKDLAQCNELIIDYTGDKTYHIYITDSEDRTKLIDITQLIIENIFPNINADNFKITIEGLLNAQTLRHIINFIYKKFLYPDDPNGFDFVEDLDKVYDNTTKSILMRDTDEIYYLPITVASNVLDATGMSVQERLDSITKLGFANDFVRATTNNQTNFEFDFPFPNYLSDGNHMELRIGTVFIEPERYSIDIRYDAEGLEVGGTIIFLDESIEYGRAINILYIYNSKDSATGPLKYMNGALIVNGSLPTSKLLKKSDRYNLADPTSVATSKAVYNLYTKVYNDLNDYSPYVLYTVDTNNTSSKGQVLFVNSDSFALRDGCKICVRLVNATKSGLKIKFNNTEYNIYDGGGLIDYPIAAGRMIDLVYSSSDSSFYIRSLSDYKVDTNHFIYTTADQETVISFNGLEYEPGQQIFVYRNGVRLFEQLDYTMNLSTEEITLYVRTEEYERIVFEVMNIERR